MKNINDVLKNMEYFRSLHGAEESLIQDAEYSLNLKFSNEYKEYLREYALASANGHELTGLCKSKRLNVVHVTKEEKENNFMIPNDFYVVERLDIDNIIIWQNEKGYIYESTKENKPKKINNSLIEYLINV